MSALSPIAATLPYSGGSILYIGWEIETVPGIPNDVSPLTYMPVEADQVNFTYDPGRKALELSTGDLYKDFIQVDEQAKLTGSFEFPVFPTMAQTLLVACGLASSGTPRGSGGTGTAALTATAVTSVTVGVGGTGYTAAPAITFTGGGGSGAAAHAVLTAGVITSFVVTAGGTGYTSVPTVVVTGAAGLGPINLPQYITFYVGRGISEEVYAGCRCKMITFTATNSKPLMCKLEFEGIEVPVVTMVGGANYLNQPTLSTAYTQEVPYIWSDLQPVTLLNVANNNSLSTKSLENIEISITFELASFYGNHQNNLPSELIPTGVSVTGKFTRLFTDVFEYQLFNEFCSIAGPLDFQWNNSVVNSGTNIFEISLPKAFYEKQSFKNPMKGAITEDYTIGTIKTLTGTPTNGSPLLFAIG